MTDFDFPADDLHFNASKPTIDRRQKFPCWQCGGTGKFRGRGKCFACNGKGSFLSSEHDRAKARGRRTASKAKKLAESLITFAEQYPDIGPALLDAARWSEFARELQGKLAQYGSLTDRQIAAVRSMAAKTAAARSARAAERQEGNETVDLSPIRAMFETARTNGYARPTYRAADLVITRAADFGRNPGALYVRNTAGDYLGKIIGTQYTGKAAVGLQAIAADPRGEAVKYGQRTGTCSCCGRLLTNEGSIEAGIGPICASKWGL